MRFKVGDEEWEFDETSLLVSEARELKKHAGMGLNGFGKGLQEGDPDAIVGMLFLVRRRSGHAVRWRDFDDFDLASIQVVADDDPDADAADGAEGADAEPVPPTSPTRVSRRGTTPKGGSPAT